MKTLYLNSLLSLMAPRHAGKPNILLIMADKILGYRLRSAFSGEFNTSICETLDLPALASLKEKPDAIIIDEHVNGTCGDELCSQIRADEATACIPIVLLLESCDSESYLLHARSGADRLELRTVDINKFRVDMHMLIDRYIFYREKLRHILMDTIHILPGIVENAGDDLMFIIQVRELLEENLSTEKYTVDMLCSDMNMCRTTFSAKMKELTGKTPTEYMLTYKMDTAKAMLASGRYNVTEIADMLGFYDAKYFGKVFKRIHGVCPTGYSKQDGVG